MKKFLIVAAVAGAAVVVMREAMKRAGPKMEEAWKRKFAEAPDDFPPKWMFLNISAIREQTERILELLKEREAASV